MSIKTKELTLTRVLVELKLYDSKIQKAIDELKPVSYSVNNVVTEYRQTPNEFIGEYNSQMQKIKDLRNNKTLLKNTLMKANATTKVTIADKEYTILEALNKKQDIQTEQYLINVLKHSLSNSVSKVNNLQEQVEDRIEKTINSKSASSGNQSKDYVQVVRDSYSDQIPKLVNADVIEKLIIEKENAVSEFLAEVDFALSEVNAITKINVDLAE